MDWLLWCWLALGVIVAIFANRHSWKLALAIVSLLVFAVLILYSRNAEQLWAIQGVEDGTARELTDIHYFHCEKDAINFARVFKKTRHEWAMREDGSKLQGRVRITVTTTTPFSEKEKSFLLFDYENGEVVIP